MIKNRELRSVTFNVLLLMGSVLVAVFIAELVVRFFYKEPVIHVDSGSSNNSVHMPSDNLKLFYQLAPGASVHADGVSYVINRSGFRDQEYSPEKNKDVKRIIFLGDSIVFGLGLETNETLWNKYLKKKERRLRF